MALTKADFLSSVKRPKSVEIDGQTFYLRVMSLRDRLSVFGDGEEAVVFGAKILTRCLCDEQGNRLFDNDDSAELLDLPYTVMDRLFDEALRLNKMQAGSVEDAIKN